MSKRPTKPTAKKPTGKTVIMFGLKDSKPHAARFVGENDTVLAKAAALMGMRLAIAQTKAHFALAGKLPAGKINATGNGLVPIIAQQIYDEINSAVGGEAGVSKPLPKSWSELAPGHLVLAQQTLGDGFCEAIITKRANDTVTLRWRDFPGLPEFIQPVGAVGLFKPD